MSGMTYSRVPLTPRAGLHLRQPMPSSSPTFGSLEYDNHTVE